MVQTIPIQKFILKNQEGICRLYDLETDPDKIIKTLYPALQNDNGITILRKEDREYLSNSKKNFRLVAEINNELVSSVVLMSDRDFDKNFTIEIFSVVTYENFRGSGISSIMLNYAFDIIKMLGGKIVRLSTESDNFRAQKFYSKIGFREIERTEKEVRYILSLE